MSLLEKLNLSPEEIKQLQAEVVEKNKADKAARNEKKIEAESVKSAFHAVVSDAVKNLNAVVEKAVEKNGWSPYELSYKITKDGVTTRSGLLGGTSSGNKNTNQISAPALLRNKGFKVERNEDKTYSITDADKNTVKTGNGQEFASAAEFARAQGYDIP